MPCFKSSLKNKLSEKVFLICGNVSYTVSEMSLWMSGNGEGVGWCQWVVGVLLTTEHKSEIIVEQNISS